MPADIERERAEQVRQVTAALKDGKLPTTAQAVNVLDKLQADASTTSVASNLSPAGKKVLADAEALMTDSRKVMTQTMPNNELQNAIYHGQRAASAAQPKMSQADAQAAADQLVQAGVKSAQLARQIVTSPEFRTLLTDISALAQDILKSNVDDATDDLANDPNAPQSVRDAAAKTRDTVRQNPDLQSAAQDAKNQAQGTYNQTSGQAQATAQDAQRRAQESGQATQNTAGDSLAQGATLRDTAKNVIDTVADQAERHLPDQAVNQASGAIREHGAKLHTGQESTTGIKNNVVSQGRATANQAMNTLRDPNSNVRQTGERVARKLVDLPEEQRREIVNRLKRVAKTIQSKPEFQRGIDDLIDILAPLGWQIQQAIPNEEVAQAASTRDAQIATKNAKALIENFANGRKLDSLVKALREFGNEARTDEELMAFWKDLGAYINRTVREPGFVEQANFDRDANNLVERGRRALDKYGDHTSKISYEARTYASALASNKATQRLQSDASALVNDLFLDERGQPTFKPELLRDLTTVIPTIADKLAYLPIPRIEIDDGTYHMIFDNIVLHSTILPKYVHLVSDTTMDATKSNPQAQLNSYVVLEISKIEASARDIAWLFNKHSGFLKAGDVGLADFDIKNEGLSVRIKLIPGQNTGVAAPSANKDDHTNQYIHAETIDTTLHNLDLRLHDSHHDLLYKLVKPILIKTAKKQIENAVSDAIRDLLKGVDRSLGQAANKIAPAMGPEPTKEIPNEWGSKAFNA
ncbi:hypothetical protein DFS34DRAFT_628757 [Phlyctochytrium arcticum]|nr:hypothetical protein DFS34DRAFT_628757 [Phlyctochytrium arcticum]